MDNLLQLQRLCAKKNLPLIIVMWVLTGILLGMAAMSYFVWDEANGLLGTLGFGLYAGIMALWITISRYIIPGRKLHPSVEKLSAEVKEKINAECLSGLQFGQAIITESGFVISVLTGKAKIILPQDIIWVYQSTRTTNVGLLPAASQSGLIVMDRTGKRNEITGKTQAFAGTNILKAPDAKAFIEKMIQTSPGAFYGYTKENLSAYAKFPEMVKTVDRRNMDRQFVR